MADMDKKGPVHVTSDGRAYIDANILFREPSELDALRKLSALAQKAIKRTQKRKDLTPAAPGWFLVRVSG
jgi:hypothetical protein